MKLIFLEVIKGTQTHKFLFDIYQKKLENQKRLKEVHGLEFTFTNDGNYLTNLTDKGADPLLHVVKNSDILKFLGIKEDRDVVRMVGLDVVKDELILVVKRDWYYPYKLKKDLVFLHQQNIRN